MMAEMREPADFPKALFTATPVMFVIYAFITCFTYYHLGNNTPPYLLDILGDPALMGSAGGEGAGGGASPWAPGTVITAHVLMLIHMIISYTLNSQVTICTAARARVDSRLAAHFLLLLCPLFCVRCIRCEFQSFMSSSMGGLRMNITHHIQVRKFVSIQTPHNTF